MNTFIHPENDGRKYYRLDIVFILRYKVILTDDSEPIDPTG